MLRLKQNTAAIVHALLVSDADPTQPTQTPAGFRPFLDLLDGDTSLTANCNMVLECLTPGDSYDITLTSAAALAITAQDNTSITITFNNGVTTAEELADLIDSDAEYIQVAYRGDLSGTLGGGDVLSAESFGGGRSNGSGAYVGVKILRNGYPVQTITPEVISPITGVLAGESGPRVMLRRSGVFQIYLTAEHTNILGEATLWLDGSAVDADNAYKAIEIVPEAFDANVVSYASGQAPLQPTVAGRTINIQADGDVDAVGVLRAAGTGSIDSGAFAANALTAAAAAADLITEIQNGLATAASIDALPTAAEIDAQLSGTHGAGSWEAGGGLTTTDIMNAMAAYAHDTGVTLGGLWVRIESFLTGERTVSASGSNLHTAYRDKNGDIAFEGDFNPTSGARPAADVTGSE